MLKIKDIPLDERPREKAKRYGVEKLSNDELLSIIISSGSNKYSALELAHMILSDSGGLNGLISMSYNDLINYDGIKSVKAIKIASVIELVKRIKFYSSENEINIDETFLYNKYSPILSFSNNENLILIMLNSRKKIIKESVLYSGLENNLYLDINVVMKTLAENNARYFYLIHNHPSGNLTPSDEDIITTKEIMKHAELFKSHLLDHLIISKKGCYSFFKDSLIIPKGTQ